MATISISNLRNSGAELLMDSESYLNELTETELNITKGGTGNSITITPITITPMTPDLTPRLTKVQ
ncbi:hypothetical protein DSM106972_081550 [Dulcicalothrix desertica PCC 7102]|uniref:Uncharacterized protein n=1 Tax=Dulcicalothrix desertica PCC 7102 TaxID=232991 RepID=A0A3S1C8T9_9CYAN|nr:hypothetical protein [Dulcicalothrix desertica]RUS98526.1 hypothetical protein DSM106972_081550 [Dulcicalothrix desertica PCC 7102]TWH54930.1 hypothetical protein CAL7102_03017 [Dulcicalothrix desertica PCC 7102]